MAEGALTSFTVYVTHIATLFVRHKLLTSESQKVGQTNTQHNSLKNGKYTQSAK